MMFSCSACGKIHPYEFDCGKRRRYGDSSDTPESKFRRGKSWTKKSLEIRSRDKFMCAYCMSHDGVINTHMIEVHHIIPIVEDYNKRLDNGNLISLCREHHEQAEKGSVDRYVLLELAEKQEQELYR